MKFGSISGLVNGTETIVYDYTVSGSAVPSISTGNILNGDEDGSYKLFIFASTAGGDVALRFNGDSGNNYGFRGIYAENTSALNAVAVTNSYLLLNSNISFTAADIYSKSGDVRMVNFSGAYQISGTTINAVQSCGGVWNNSVDNITSISIVGSTNLGVGSRVILMKCNNFTGGTPTGVINTPCIDSSWVRVGSSILATTASTINFSNLSGNTAILYRITGQWKQANASGDCRVRINSDTGTNYGYQTCYADATTITAARGASDNIVTGWNTAEVGDYGSIDIVLFSKSGFLRPMFIKDGADISTTSVSTTSISGQVWNNTSDEITSISLYQTGSGKFDIGTQFELYALYK